LAVKVIRSNMRYMPKTEAATVLVKFFFFREIGRQKICHFVTA
jgi:hypothetical protein